MKLSQIRLVVHDFATMFRFYRDVLGARPQVDDERGPYAKLSFGDGGTALALQSRAHFEEVALPMPDVSAGRTVIALHVADVDALAFVLRGRGAAIVRGPVDLWGRMRVAYLRDPEGHVIELQQWLAPA